MCVDVFKTRPYNYTCANRNQIFQKKAEGGLCVRAASGGWCALSAKGGYVRGDLIRRGGGRRGRLRSVVWCVIPS